MAEHLAPEDTQQTLVGRWQQTEPLRLHLYAVAVPLVALLVGYGLLSGHLGGLWLAVIAAALLGGGTEVARGFVVAPATARAAVQAAANDDDGGPAAARDVLIRYRIPS